MPGPIGNYDNIIRRILTPKTTYGTLKDEEADMEAWSQPQHYPQPYKPGNMQDMVIGMESLHNYRDLMLPEEQENIYRFPNKDRWQAYSDKPVPDDPWSDEPARTWRRAGDDPNQAKNEMIKAWMDWYSRGRDQIEQEIQTLPPDELEQWKRNDWKQVDEMERRFQYSPRRYSR